MSAPIGNKFAIGNSGKEKDFDSPGELDIFIDEYFEWCDNNPIPVWHSQLDKTTGSPVSIPTIRPYTVEGLSRHLGVTRQTLLNYQKREGYEEFFDVIKRAKERITEQRVEMGTLGVFKEGFTKFLLINNTEYVDRVEQKNTNQNLNYNTGLTTEEIQQISKALENDC